MLAGSSFGGQDNRSPMLRSRLGAWGTQGLAVMARVLIGRTWVRADYAPGVLSALSPGPALQTPPAPCLPQRVLKPTVFDWRKSLSIHDGLLLYRRHHCPLGGLVTR
jgi:hypothetical protein